MWTIPVSCENRPVQREGHRAEAQEDEAQVQRLRRRGVRAEAEVEERRVDEGDGCTAKGTSEGEETVEVVLAPEGNDGEGHHLCDAQGVLRPGVSLRLHHAKYPELCDARSGQEHQRQGEHQCKHVAYLDDVGEGCLRIQVQQHHCLHIAPICIVTDNPKDGKHHGDTNKELDKQRPEAVWLLHGALDGQDHWHPLEGEDCHADENAASVALEGNDRRVNGVPLGPNQREAGNQDNTHAEEYEAISDEVGVLEALNRPNHAQRDQYEQLKKDDSVHGQDVHGGGKLADKDEVGYAEPKLRDHDGNLHDVLALWTRRQHRNLAKARAACLPPAVEEQPYANSVDHGYGQDDRRAEEPTALGERTRQEGDAASHEALQHR
mmetsp:Transcript_125314/g.348680  ORF Transcript_125314/g.348680 Transcript_125314/m.348680 type:complete len:378 (-) Transcript_125314:439-1572(-)